MTVEELPTQRQYYATFAAFCAALNPVDKEGKVNVAALERLFTEDVKVEYLGYVSNKWKTLTGRANVIACLVEEAAKDLVVLKKTIYIGESGIEVRAALQAPEGTLLMAELYTMEIVNGECLIKYVNADQKLQDQHNQSYWVVR